MYKPKGPSRRGLSLVLLLHPEWDAHPSQHLNLPVHVNTPGWRKELRAQYNVPGQGLNLDCSILGVSALTTRPWHFHNRFTVNSTFLSYHQDYTFDSISHPSQSALVSPTFSRIKR